jgi:sulfite reductase alpha subunit-like flavoprotein
MQEVLELTHHRYEPGDVAIPYLENSPVDVEKPLQRLGWAQCADAPTYVM